MDSRLSKEMLARLLARYGTFARYCVVGGLASLIFYLTANLCAKALHSQAALELLASLLARFSLGATITASQAASQAGELVATLCGSLASFVFGYFAQMKLAFQVAARHSSMLPRYCILLALIALYAQVLAYLGGIAGLDYRLSSAGIALSVPLFSYPLQRFWVFQLRDCSLESTDSREGRTSSGGGRHID